MGIEFRSRGPGSRQTSLGGRSQPAWGSRQVAVFPAHRRSGIRRRSFGATLLDVVDDQLFRLRAFALALPEVNERLSHGAPCFFIRDKRPLCYIHDDDFDARGRVTRL